jgi:hypothetical protein
VVAPVYDPQFRANSHQGRPGDSVALTGSGFAPGEQVSVALRPGVTAVATSVAGQDGSLNLEFTIPEAIKPGRYTIVVTGETSASPTETKFKIQEPKKPSKGKGHNSGPTKPGKGKDKPGQPAPTVTPTRRS